MKRNCAEMKFVDGFKIIKFHSSDEKFSAIPFALTISDKLLGVIDKINAPQVEEIEPLAEEIAKTDAPPIEKLPDKEKIAEKASAEEKIFAVLAIRMCLVTSTAFADNSIKATYLGVVGKLKMDNGSSA